MATKGSSNGPAPWKRKRPAGAKKTTLTPASRAKARASARKAGRPYPNLVDNMRAASEQRSRKKPAGAGPRKAAGSRKTAGGKRKTAAARQPSARKASAKRR
jgi:hypothetical protein